MPAPQIIIDLVERFERNIISYKSGVYNETQVRREFIDPFFEALGWDVANKSGYAEAYKDVVHEYSQKTADTTEAPDYLFRIGSTKKFFVEAKKPSVNLSDDISPAFQLRRYAWTAKLPLSILTDFEELAVYDCRIKPNKNDKASVARVNYFDYKDYLKNWDEIALVFSKDSILKGSFDKYAESNKNKKGTSEVDDAFLKEIEHWRELLAKNIALRNPKLTNRELNFAVQKSIDRIIFLRICEDRGIEEYGQLMALKNGTNVYPRLLQIFTRADEKYNSGLFHFEDEKGRNEPPDTITPKIKIDDKTLKDIVNNLYYPESPYEFSVLPAEILGHVYEQFLGKVIRLTASHQAKIDEKPEVKKAGGVYYTPTYIVEYIVKNTLGKILQTTPFNSPSLLRRGTQGEVRNAAKLKILDPACGSGSFLLGAFQYLLDWHLRFYVKTLVETTGSVVSKKGETDNSLSRQRLGIVSTKDSPIYRAQNNEWRLTTSERKRILLNNIYGVDIDPQAVEVTKLSLLLKVLEGETEESLSSQLKMFRERALPDLSNNIKCGNSLIGPDFYDQPSLSFTRRGTEGEVMLDDEERLRINVFDWNEEFKDIMNPSSSSGGGFDVVIGNPPYGALFNESTISYLKNKFRTYVGRGESYLLFCEKSISLLNEGGLFGYIIPDTYLNLGFTYSLRNYLLTNSLIIEVVRLPSSVFKATSVDTTLLFAQKKDTKEKDHGKHVRIKHFDKKEKINSLENPNKNFSIDYRKFCENNFFNIQLNTTESKLISKIEMTCNSLESFSKMFSGIKSYEVGKGIPPQTAKIRDEKPFTSKKCLGKEWFPFFEGKDIDRYRLLWKENNWIKYGPWLAAPREKENFIGEKILIRKIVGKTLIATYIQKDSYCNTLLFVLKINEGSAIKYRPLLGILNSKFIGWYYRKKFQISDDDTFPQIMIRDILQFPIPLIPKPLSQKLDYSVSSILKLSSSIIKTIVPSEKEVLQRQINATDKQIDKLVYELYGLTEEEIAIVEGEQK